MTKTTPESCQMRSKTDYPCIRPAVAEVRGIPFCEACASEQEAYFVVGELAQAQAMLSDWTIQAQGLPNRPLTEMLNRMRRELTERVAEAGRRLGTSKRRAGCVRETNHEKAAVVELPRQLRGIPARRTG